MEKKSELNQMYELSSHINKLWKDTMLEVLASGGKIGAKEINYMHDETRKTLEITQMFS
jgi:hypothetical protein